jgi:hypothetical protein
MKLAIFFFFFTASETRRHESLILNVMGKCLPHEKYVNLNFASEYINADETLNLIFDNFLDNTGVYVSSVR